MAGSGEGLIDGFSLTDNTRCDNTAGIFLRFWFCAPGFVF